MYYLTSLLELQNVVNASEVNQSNASSFDRPNLTDFYVIVLGCVGNIIIIGYFTLPNLTDFYVVGCVGNIIISAVTIGYFTLGLKTVSRLSPYNR